jgi:hypothetical protein
MNFYLVFVEMYCYHSHSNLNIYCHDTYTSNIKKNEKKKKKKKKKKNKKKNNNNLAKYYIVYNVLQVRNS